MGIYAKGREKAVLFTQLESPVGRLLLVSDGDALTGLYMEKDPLPEWRRRDDLPVFRQTKAWLEHYFTGAPEEAGAVPLKLEGTPFQRAVWALLLTIPYGKTRTYGELARQLAGEPDRGKMSAQAVGQAVGRNPVSIIVPCHRVVGRGGKLTGYAGGIDKKAWLLRHEEETR